MDSGLAWPVSSEISSGSKSSRSDWITVLRPLEFVNLPSREALDLALSTGLRKKLPETLSPF